MRRQAGRAAVLILIGLGLAGTQGAHPGAADADLTLGAAAGSIQPLRGMNVGPLGNSTFPNLTSAYQDRAVNLIRTHDFQGPLDMGTMYPDRSKSPALASSYNFTGMVGFEFHSSDDTFRSIVDNGFEPYLRLGDSSSNATPPTVSQFPNWEQAALQVIRHYREGAMNGFTSNLRYIEIWNEPNNQSFWPPPNTNADYFKLYTETATLLKAAIPALIVGGPAIGSSGCTSTTGQAYTRSFLDAVRAANAPLDFFSWHLYTNAPDDYVTCAKFYRTELDTRGFTSTVQIVSEWNSDASGVSASVAVDVRANARGAAINTAAWIGMQTSGVSQETFYKGPEPATDDGSFYGMFRSSGVPKKVGYAALLWSALSQYPTRLAVSGGASNFYAIAANSTTSGTAVLVSNNSSSARTWSVSNLPGSSVTVKTVSDAADGVITTTQTTGTFSIPAYGVQLITVGAVPTSTQTFTATATASGSSSSLTLDLSMTVAAADIGQSGQIYIAANLGSQWYFFNGSSWQQWTTGNYPAYLSGTLPSSSTVRVLSVTNVNAFRGASIYVAYGRSQADMLTRGLYKLVYTL